MGKSNFGDEFKRDAVRQITERRYPVSEVSQRPGVSRHSLYEWKKKVFSMPGGQGSDQSEEIRQLKREFDVAAPDKAWVKHITYIRTSEGFACLAVVINLYSRRVIGRSMQSPQTTDVVLQALLMAVWRRKPKEKVWCIRIRDRNSPVWTGQRS